MKIIENDSGFASGELFGLAKRENNNKRKNLLVNRIQAKHIPAVPSQTLELFARLGDKVKNGINTEKKTAVIGFAETATAIGMAVAERIGGECFYIHTTRERIPSDLKITDFSEEHSHASEQLLYSLQGKDTFKGVSQIIFVDDELTTGKTILNFVNALKGIADDSCRFFAASLINGMNEENSEKFDSLGIGVFYLVKIDDTLADMNEEIDVTAVSDIVPVQTGKKIFSICIDAETADMRTGCFAEGYAAGCERTVSKIVRLLEKALEGVKTIDVIGTEEFMYPAVILGQMLESRGYEVRTHSATRSPIVPSSDSGYPLDMRCRLHSFYDRERTTYLYNLYKCDMTILLTDSEFADSRTLDEFASVIKSPKSAAVMWRNYMKRVRTSYKWQDVTILLKDITGLVEPLGTKEREKRIQSGTHYCEMLPLEYQPSKEYIRQYEIALERFSEITARAVKVAAERIYMDKRHRVLVSMARAGIPAGIMFKHYLERKYGIHVPHYSISIIRGRGIDKNALDYILACYGEDEIRFVDGWTGKGAIQNQLIEAMKDYPGIDPRLAVIADPAGITPFCGTHDDFLIASSCLNSTVSGLISRSFLRSDLIGANDFHGAAYYGELIDHDRSYEFINAVESKLTYEDIEVTEDSFEGITGAEEAENIRRDLGISDINFVKPGIGETTRVLLRRVPHVILIAEDCEDIYISHILELAKEKNVPVRRYPLKRYRCCGIIKNLPGDA